MGRTSGPEGARPLFVGLACAPFVPGMAASGVTAAWKRALGGGALSAREGGARLYLMDGISREAKQELGALKTPGVMEGVYYKAKREGAAPGMRSATGRACA